MVAFIWIVLILFVGVSMMVKLGQDAGINTYADLSGFMSNMPGGILVVIIVGLLFVGSIFPRKK